MSRNRDVGRKLVGLRSALNQATRAMAQEAREAHYERRYLDVARLVVDSEVRLRNAYFLIVVELCKELGLAPPRDAKRGLREALAALDKATGGS